MAITVHSLDASTVAGTLQTFVSGSFTPDANSVLIVFISNGRGNHTTAYNYAITDSAGLSWTELYDTGDIDTPGGTNFLARGKVWTATAGASPSSMTVTVDPFDGSTGGSADAFGTLGVIGCPAGVTLSPAVYGAEVAANNTDTSTDDLLLDLGQTPSGEQVFMLCVFRNATGTHTFDSAPTDFSISASDTTGYAPAAVLYSSTNTDQTVTYGGTFGGNARSNMGFFIQLTAAGGTTYPITPSGSVTSAAALTRQTAKPLAGTSTSAGALARQTAKPLAGTVTSSGALAAVKAALRSFAGTVTSSATLSRQTGKALAGTSTSSGAFSRSVSLARSFAGAVSVAGALTRQPRKAFAGSIASSSTLGRVKVALLALSGAMGLSGALSRRTGKALAGALSPTASLVRRAGKALAGVLTSSGATTATGGAPPTEPWSWAVSDGSTLHPASALLSGTEATTADVG